MVFLIIPPNVEGKVNLTATGEIIGMEGMLTQHNGLMETSCPKMVSAVSGCGRWKVGEIKE
jgi:hypothetical protein